MTNDEKLTLAREALEFYADPKNNAPGALARETLAKIDATESAPAAGAALAQRAAGELPPLPEPGIDVYRIKGYKADQMHAYARNHETHLMLSHAPLMDAASAKHRIASLEAQLAARAVGVVDLSSLKRYSPTYDESRGADGEDRWGVMEDAEEGEYVKLTDVRALLAAAPAAPVGDGDERALYTCIGKGGEYELIGYSNGAGAKRGEVIAIYSDTREKDIFYHRTQADFDARMQRIDRAALTQQKG